MRKSRKQSPPWAAFADSIFAVLLIILLIVILFLVFRVLYVVDSEKNIDLDNLLFGVKKFIVKSGEEVEQQPEVLTFINTDKAIQTNFSHYQTLESTILLRLVENFIKQNNDKFFKLSINIPTLSKSGLRQNIYSKTLSLVNTLFSKNNHKVSVKLLYHQKKDIYFQLEASDLLSQEYNDQISIKLFENN